MKTTKTPITQAIVTVTLALAFLLTPVSQALASADSDNEGHSEEQSFDPGHVIMHHIKDDYRWHFFTIGDFHATLYFPVILYEPGQGLSIFSSRHLYHGEDHSYKGYELAGNEIKSQKGGSVYDFSMTKNVVAMLISAVLMILIFLAVAKRYKRDPKEPPKGIQSLLEPVIVFVRDEIAKPGVGEEKWHKYFPFIITVFFFILINNLLGLLPGAANVTGNIAVTAALALITFVITNISASKAYWQHIFNMPGVPIWLKIPIPVVPIVEFLGIFTKPFALAIRLFANMMAGHILILSLVSLIFIFGEISPGLGFAISPISVLFTLFIYLIKLLVSAVQAYIFAMLSSVFIGMAIEEEH